MSGNFAQQYTHTPPLSTSTQNVSGSMIHSSFGLSRQSSYLLDNQPVKFIPVVSARVSCHEFTKSWNHCQQLANFVARVTASNRVNSERYSYLLSTFLQRILERVFGVHTPEHYIWVDVLEAENKLLLEVSLPLGPQVKQSYQQLFDELKNENGEKEEVVYRRESGFQNRRFHHLDGRWMGNYELNYSVRTSQGSAMFVFSILLSFSED